VPRRAQGYAQAYIAVATHLMKFIRRLVCKKRKLLFEIDPRTFQAALDQTKGQLANAEGQLAQAKANPVKAQIEVDR
jgi:hypothetical protein